MATFIISKQHLKLMSKLQRQITCYSLNFKCSPKAYILEAWASAHGIMRSWWNFWEMGPGEVLRSSGHALEEHPPLPSFLARGKQLCSTICSCDVAPQAQNKGPTDHGLKSPKLSWEKLLISWPSQIFPQQRKANTLPLKVKLPKTLFLNQYQYNASWVQKLTSSLWTFSLHK